MIVTIRQACDCALPPDSAPCSTLSSSLFAEFQSLATSASSGHGPSFMGASDSEIGMVDRPFGDDFFEQNRSWDDFGTIISGIQGTHQNLMGSRMQVLLTVHRVDSKLKSF